MTETPIGGTPIVRGFGLIPEQTGRYRKPQGEGKSRKWERNEDHITRAVILSCQTEHDYLRACYFLCRFLDRRPGLFTGAVYGKPYHQDVKYCEALVGNRISDMVRAYRDFKPDVVYNDFTREGRGLCYAEAEIYLAKYRRTRYKPQLQHLATILGRKTTDIIKEALASKEPRSTLVPTPLVCKFDSREAIELKEQFLKLCFDKQEDEAQIRDIWRELDRLYRE